MITNFNDELINSLATVRAQMQIDHAEYLLRMPIDEKEQKERIKKELIIKLLDEMMKSNCIEFTAQLDTSQLSNIYRARIVTVPNWAISKLRQEGKIK